MKGSFTLVDVLLVLALLNEATLTVKGRPHCKQTNSGVFRPHSVSISEFGAVAGRWLTGSFVLISHLTLRLDKDATILGSTNSDDWPLTDPLPSYGRGRELPGGRHRSLLYGNNLTDVVITGDNGTIDGQGTVWWNWFRNETLDYTRPHLVELMNSNGVFISNLTFLNSPFWNIHPVYCRSNVLRPQISSRDYLVNGAQFNSSNDVCIEDCYISTGDDLIAIKSGWDEYGISFARPSTNIIIHRLVGETRSSSGIAIGSEMSGGVSEVHAEDLQFFNSNAGITIKTSPGRGGYVKNIFISDVTLMDVNVAIRVIGQYGEHPDEFYDPNALPLIEMITIQDVTGENVKVAGLMEGIKEDDFHNICLFNLSLSVSSGSPWNCSYIQGYSDLVSPETCQPLKERIFPEHSSDCYHLSDHLRRMSSRNGGDQFLSW
ncbi:unnamed protein product [Ilex paraguariensis]|uniref:Polygalacturonase n=1 Tax=Ilex paraguariensis TaxID=185542 RepID=A0ABC8RBB2_9AQUA